MKPVAPKQFVELALFASRWLLAPLYLGLIVALGVLLYTFFGQLFDLLRALPDMKQTAVVLALLTLISYRAHSRARHCVIIASPALAMQ